MPIREALKELAVQGLVEHVPYRGMREVEFSPEEVVDLHVHRSFLGGRAARAAAGTIQPETIARLRSLQDQMEEHMALEDLDVYRDLNRRFHETIFAASKYPYLVRTLKQMWEAFPTMLWGSSPGMPTSSLSECDRVLYRDDGEGDQNQSEAEALAAKLEEMLLAYGHTMIHEFPPEKYIEKKLHRSTSGAALLVGRIPAFTVELGSGQMPDPVIVNASAAGTRNVMRWAGMLDGDYEKIGGIQVVDPGFPVRRRGTPRVKEACVVFHLVQPGDLLTAGDPVAEVSDVWGRPIGDGVLRAEYDGFVVGRSHGIYYYPGDPVLGMAVRDEAPLVAPYPEDYFEEDD